jgi:hypothetical protein
MCSDCLWTNGILCGWFHETPIGTGYSQRSPFLRLQWEHGCVRSHRTLRLAHGTQLRGMSGGDIDRFTSAVTFNPLSEVAQRNRVINWESERALHRDEVKC